MIDRQAIKALDAEARITRLKEMAEERRRELQLIESLLKETTSELRDAASLHDEEAAIVQRQLAAVEARGRPLEEAEAPPPLDERISHAVLATVSEEERSTLAELAKAATIPGLYHAPAMDASDMRPSYQAFEGYTSFKHEGYESLWRQQEDSKFKKHEQKKEERHPSLL